MTRLQECDMCTTYSGQLQHMLMVATVTQFDHDDHISLVMVDGRNLKVGFKIATHQQNLMLLAFLWAPASI